MKSKLTKIWGVGLTLVLMVSLLVIAAPASAADPLQWNSEVLPGATNQVVVEGLDIMDFAIAADGTTIYAVGAISTTYNKVYKSMNAGRTWIDITGLGGLTAETSFHAGFVAIAPDNSSVVAIAQDSTDNCTVYLTNNGGASWSSLGTAKDVDDNPAQHIYDLDVSSEVPPGVRYVTVCGTDAGDPGIYYYDLGSAMGDWRDAVTDFTTDLGTTYVDAFYSIEFSPNFSADYTLVAISSDSANTSTKGEMRLHALGFNQQVWNDFTGYPVLVQQAVANGANWAVAAADVGLAPDYVGSDDISRVAFVAAGIDDDGSEVGGIFRCDDSTPYDLKVGYPMNSIDFNGTDIVAGAYDSNYVWRSADPLVTQPTVIPSRANKRIGVDAASTNDAVIVAWNGDEVLGAKQLAASAFSVSRDNGNTWNDIALIDANLNDINDVWPTTDGTILYICADDGTETSVYRQSGGVWERVLVLADNSNYILRGAPDDNNGLYVANDGGTAIYYTADAGENRWYTRTAPGNIDEMVVESADVCYIGDDAAVRKSVNSGFTWSLPITPELQGDNVVSMTSLAEDQLIIGGHQGNISYTTDGGDTWVKMDKGITLPPSANRVQVTASGLATGDYIYATGSKAGEVVWRWTVGDSPAYDWINLGATTDASDSALGIALVENVLYVSTANTTDTEVIRCVGADGPRGSHEWSSINDAARQGTNTTQALRVSTGASMKMWYVHNDASTPFDAVRTYIDTMATVSPEISAPADAFMNPMNPVTGRSVDVSFTWPRISTNVTYYDIDICTDAACLNLVQRHNFFAPGPSALILMGPYQALTQSVEFVSGMTYYWRARASTPIYSAWSPVRTLVIQAGAASVPSIGAPVNGASITNTSPAFSWSPVVGATKYEFQLSADAGFALPLLASTKLVSTGIQPAVTLDAGVTYFWRVRSLEPQEGSWSTIANFTVAVPVEPAAPVVIPPAQAPVVNIPDIVVPAPIVNIPPAPEPAAPISQGLLLAIIIIGAILVIAVIVLIVRTRRAV